MQCFMRVFIAILRAFMGHLCPTSMRIGVLLLSIVIEQGKEDIIRIHGQVYSLL